MKTVSVLTPTTRDRYDYLELLAECVRGQEYPVKEWIIVSGDVSWSREQFRVSMERVQEKVPNISVVSYYADKSAIGHLRNVTNELASQDICVCMDDDDYYPPTRVKHAVKVLESSPYLVAGCPNHYMYDDDLKTVFQFQTIHKNHAVNNTLAYKKEYANRARYDASKEFAEETDFLNKFRIPLGQLDAKQTVVQMIHSRNTFNKRKLIFDSHYTRRGSIQSVSTIPRAYIQPSLFERYRQVVNPDSFHDFHCPYDVVFYLGYGYPVWTPSLSSQESLGGSEQAVLHLASEWVKLRRHVVVYGDFTQSFLERHKESRTLGSVHFEHYLQFKSSVQYKTLILWRNFGIYPLACYPLRAQSLFIDIHDTLSLPSVPLIQQAEQVSAVMLKSKFHVRAFMKLNPSFPSIKLRYIPNGIRTCLFTDDSHDSHISRDLYRFCWCSCYTRGLESILKWLFPALRVFEPRVEFHVYYGMEQVKSVEFRERMVPLLNQDGVIDHGRRSVEDIRREKRTSSFHLYFSKTQAETDCISIRESACSGCIPLLSKYNVFSERSGIHFDGDPASKTDMEFVAASIADLLKNRDKVETIRKELVEKEKCMKQDWSHIASSWSATIDHFNSVKNEGTP